MREVVAVARKVLSIEAHPDWGTAPARRWDTESWVADISAARSELEWEPRYSLEEGFATTVGWLRGEPRVWDRYGASSRLGTF
jgi:nucleoside-diphosphate-sugar epimerase